MKNVNFLVLAVVAAVCVWTLPRASASVHSMAPSAIASQQPSTQQPATPNVGSSQQQPQAQTFTGKITKKSGQYVLENETAKTTYHLDDQQKAAQFAGQKVTVTGTLDAQSNTIHVTDIQPASA